MTAWADGYVSDIQYTSGFYRELSPAYLDFMCLLSGVRPPARRLGMTYCELACGQGFGTSLLAAANPDVNFWGFDFNPAQIATARHLAARAKLDNITFGEESFAELNALPSSALPLFDYIVLHGIYSWISEANRNAIVQFLANRLRPGGLVYVSYNCMPGWAHVAPLQRIMREHAKTHPARSDKQAEAASEFAKQLRSEGSLYFETNPAVGQRLDKLQSMNRNYLAHEYLNGFWHPLYHADVVGELEPAKLVFMASATITENNDIFCVPEGMRSTVNSTSDSTFKETIRDFAINKQFRKDLFVKGLNFLSAAEQAEVIRSSCITLISPRSSVPTTISIPLGQATLQQNIYGPILDALAVRPHSILELEQLPELLNQPLQIVLQAVALLIHGQHVHPLRLSYDSGSESKALDMNAIVARQTLYADTLQAFSAPGIGSAISVSYTDRLAYLVYLEDPEVDRNGAIESVWEKMKQTGHRLARDGAAIQSREETIPLLADQMEQFFDVKLPLWRRLGIVN